MRAVGLEITSNAVKAVLVEGTGARFRIRDFVVQKMAQAGEGAGEIPPGDVDIIGVLREIFRRHKLPRTPVVASIRAQDCVIREITVPFTRDEQIQKTIRFQAESHFHSVAIDDLVLQWYKIEELEGKSRLLVAGLKKTHIERQLHLLGEVSVDPSALDLDVAALFNAYEVGGLFADKGVVLVVDIEADTLKLLLVQGGRLLAARSVRMRLGAIMQRGARSRSGRQSARLSGRADAFDDGLDDSEDAHEMRADSSRLPVVILDDGSEEAAGFRLEDSQITEVERENYLQKIFLEIDRTLAATHAADDVDLIALTGASCTLEGIEGLFEEHFEIPSQRIELSELIPADQARVDKETVDFQAPIPVGLALKALGHDAGGFDFRRDEFSFQGKFERVRRGVAATLCLTFLLLFVVAYGFKVELERIGIKRERAQLEQDVLLLTMFPELGEIPADRDRYRIWQDQKYTLEQRYGETDDIKRVFKLSALDILAEFCRGMKPYQGNVTIKQLTVGQERSTIAGTADSNEIPALIEQAVNNTSKVVRAKVERFGKNTKGGWDFTIKVEVIEGTES